MQADDGRALQFATYGGVKSWMNNECFDVKILLQSGNTYSARPCALTVPVVVQASFANP